MREQKKVQAADKVVKFIHGYVKQHDLHPGDLLPTEMEIAQSLRISRGSVREGMGRLRAIGMVQSRTKTGARLTRARPRELLTEMIPSLVQTKIQFRELGEFRVVIETGAVALAAVHRTGRDLEALSNILAKEQSAIKNGFAKFCAEDTRFHLCILDISHNALLAATGEVISTFLDQGLDIYDLKLTRAEQHALMKRTQFEHQEIFEAIDRGDAAAAATLMRVHAEKNVRL